MDTAKVAILFYIFTLILTLFYVWYTGDRYTIENFSGVVITTSDPIGKCLECSTFYSSILGIPDPTQIVPSIANLNTLYDDFFTNMNNFVVSPPTSCSNVATISDYINCVTGFITKLPCPAGFSTTDCVTRENLLSTIVGKAMICGSNVTCSTLPDFKVNFVATLSSLNDDYNTCKELFSKTNSQCVTQYADVITLKIKGTNSNQAVADAVTLVSQADLNKQLYDMTTFVATSGYKG